ncbi:MAG: ABC transporter substrate-binding protein [Desulfurococcales archaeon]|nr:ABC transporter substrate-binding protein [Desulfurococcales archaeon]
MFRSNSRMALAIILVILVLAPMLAGPASARDFPEEEYENTIYIGASVSLSGDYEFEGGQALCGMKAAIDWINSNGGIEIAGKNWFFKLVFEDDKSDPQKAVEIYRSLYDQGIRFFLAPYSESLANEVAIALNKYDIVLMLYGPSSDRLARQYKNTIQISSTTYNKYHNLFNMLKDLGAKNVIIVSDGSAYAANSVKAVIRAANNAGIEVSATINYLGEGSIKKMLDTDYKGRYSLLLILSDSLSRFKDIAIEAYNSLSTFEMVAGDVVVSFPHFYLEIGGSRAENIMGVSEWEERDLYSKEMATQFKADWYGPANTTEWAEYYSKYCKTGVPGSVAASASAAVFALANYIYWAGSTNPAAVKAKAPDIFMLTFYGPIRVDDKGYQVGHIPLIIQWIDGYKKIVYPDKYADAEPRYPASNWMERGVTKTMTEEGAGEEQGQAEDTVQTPVQTGAEAGEQEEGGFPVAVAVAVIVIVAAIAGFMALRGRK